MSTTQNTISSYNKFAKEYTENITSDTNFWNKYLESPALLETLPKDMSSKRVLDLGCGSGESSKKLLERGANVTGIDISEEMIKIAQNELPDYEFLVSDMENLKFENDSFDIVSSSLALHYVQDLKKTFSEVYRVLSKEGIFVFSMNHPVSTSSEKVLIDGEKKFVLKPYFHNDLYQWSMIGGQMQMDSYHHKFSDITNGLIEVGFNIEKVIETTPVPEGKNVSPENYEMTMQIPSFIVYRVVKN